MTTVNAAPHLTRPHPRLTRLDEILATQPGGLPRALAQAELSSLSGEPGAAMVALREITGRSWSDLNNNIGFFARALGVTIAAADLSAAAALINRRCDSDWFDVGIEQNTHRHRDAVRWEIKDKAKSVLWFDSQFAQSSGMEPTLVRLVSLLPLLVAYRSYDQFVGGTVWLNLGDVGHVPGLAFCDSRPEYFLIPDAVFVLHRGYASLRTAEHSGRIPWDETKPVAFWRGGTSGQPTDASIGWRSLPRIRLCQIAQDHPDILDAGITHIGQMPHADSEREIRATGVMRPFIPPADFATFRYQIDIDGNTNSWPGLFQKLLLGNPVLKVASPHGYRQWYYDRLRPWINFVPVLSDMSDLIEKINWLRANDYAARQIGENGRTLALALSYDVELPAARRNSSGSFALLRWAA